MLAHGASVCRAVTAIRGILSCATTHRETRLTPKVAWAAHVPHLLPVRPLNPWPC